MRHLPHEAFLEGLGGRLFDPSLQGGRAPSIHLAEQAQSGTRTDTVFHRPKVPGYHDGLLATLRPVVLVAGQLDAVAHRDLRHRTGLVSQDGGGEVLALHFLAHEVAGHPAHIGSLPEDFSQAIDKVPRAIDPDPSAGLFPAEAEIPWPEIQPLSGLGLCEQRPPDEPLPYQGDHALESGMEQSVVRNHQLHPCHPTDAVDLLRLFQGCGDRLFQKYRLPGAGGKRDKLHMQIMRQKDANCVHLDRFQQFLKRNKSRHPPLLTALLNRLHPHVAHRRQPGPRSRRLECRVMHVRHTPHSHKCQ